jgi:hypothetical protein
MIFRFPCLKKANSLNFPSSRHTPLADFSFWLISWAAPEEIFFVDHRSGSGISGTFLRHRTFGQLERDVPAMGDDFGSDLDQFLS